MNITQFPLVTRIAIEEEQYEIINALLIGVILIIAGAIMEFLFRKIKKWITLSKPISKILGTIAKTKKVLIIIPKLYSTQQFLQKNPANAHQTILWNQNFPLFAEGDSKAIMYLNRFLVGLGKIKKIELKSDTETIGTEEEQELICIGAGSNNLTRNFLVAVRPRIEFSQQIIRGQQIYGMNIRDRQTNETWTANRNDDYGLIIRLKNPRNRDAHIFILAGLGPSGTTAAGYYLSHKWRDIYNHLKKENTLEEDYEVLIKTEQTNHTHVELIKIVII